MASTIKENLDTFCQKDRICSFLFPIFVGVVIFFCHVGVCGCPRFPQKNAIMSCDAQHQSRKNDDFRTGGVVESKLACLLFSGGGRLP